MPPIEKTHVDDSIPGSESAKISEIQCKLNEVIVRLNELNVVSLGELSKLVNAMARNRLADILGPETVLQAKLFKSLMDEGRSQDDASKMRLFSESITVKVVQVLFNEGDLK